MQQISAGAVDPDNGNGSTFALATVFGQIPLKEADLRYLDVWQGLCTVSI